MPFFFPQQLKTTRTTTQHNRRDHNKTIIYIYCEKGCQRDGMYIVSSLESAKKRQYVLQIEDRWHSVTFREERLGLLLELFQQQLSPLCLCRHEVS